MIRIFRSTLLALALAPWHLSAGDPIPLAPLSPLAQLDADKGTSFVARREILKRRIDECMEIARRMKKNPPGTKEDRERLKELHAELDRLPDDHDAELSRALPDESETDPSEVYFRGWMHAREAEKIRDAGDSAGARRQFETALGCFEQIAKNNPNWKPEMVKDRITRTKEALSSLLAAEG